jgi:hypothetical protein
MGECFFPADYDEGEACGITVVELGPHRAFWWHLLLRGTGQGAAILHVYCCVLTLSTLRSLPSPPSPLGAARFREAAADAGASIQSMKVQGLTTDVAILRTRDKSDKRVLVHISGTGSPVCIVQLAR